MAGRCNSCGNPTVDELIEAILARMICEREGLDVDEARRCLRVILAPGGGLEFDQFGRLRSNCCDGGEPQPAACVQTVDGLGEFIVGGNYGGAGLLHAYGSPQALEYTLTHGLDMVVNDVWGTEDEVAVWSIQAPVTQLASYTTSPATSPGAGVTSSDWISLHVDAGTTESPTSRNAYAPPDHRDPDGGWYGWYAPQYQPMTFGGVLRGLSQRVVTWADILTLDGNPAFDQRSVVAAIRAVSGACTHASTILAVHPSMLSWVPAIENAGITPGVYVPANDALDIDVIAASGAQWLRLTYGRPSAVIQQAVAAGLQVVLRTAGRHVQTQRALDLGVRGIHTFDPVYARQPLDPSLFGYYRRSHISYVRRQTEVGHLTARTDDISIISGRPYTKTTEFGLFHYVTPSTRPRSATLIGEACPLPSPEEDSYTWECQVDAPGGPLPDGTAPKIGVNICQTTDVDTTPPTEDGNYDGYTAFIRVGQGSTGQLEIGKFTPGEPYEMLAQSTTARPVPPNDWMSFRLEVTATTITLTRTDGTPYSVSVTDSTYRGPYVSWLVNTSESAASMVAGVRQFIVASEANAAEDSSAEAMSRVITEAMDQPAS